MKLLEQLQSLQANDSFNGYPVLTLRSEKFPTAPVKKEWEGNTTVSLPAGWAFPVRGGLFVQLNVVNQLEDLTHEANAIFSNQKTDVESPSLAVIPFVPGKGWIRIGVGADVQGGLQIPIPGAAANVGGNVNSQFALFLPGGLDETPIGVVTNTLSHYFEDQPFAPKTFLPEHGGIEVSLEGGIKFEAALRLSDIVVAGVQTLASKGAEFVAFTPIETKADVKFGVHVNGGFVLQVGRLPAEGETIPYRFKIATTSTKGASFGVDLLVRGTASFEPALNQLDVELAKLFGVPKGIGFFEALKRKSNDLLLKTGLSGELADKAGPEIEDWITDFKKDLIEKITFDVSAQVAFSLSKSTTRDTLYQWSSRFTDDENWDPVLRTALVKRDIGLIHERVVALGNETNRCTPETYTIHTRKREEVDVGINIKLGRLSLSASNGSEFNFEKKEDLLAQTQSHAFKFNRSRFRSGFFESDAWEANLIANPVKGKEGNTFKELSYEFDFLWQSDGDKGGNRKLNYDAVGECIDLLTLLKKETFPKKHTQEQFMTDVWLWLSSADVDLADEKGFTTVEVSIDPVQEADFLQNIENFIQLVADKNKMKPLCVKALPWSKRPHRKTMKIREQIFSNYVSEVMDKSLGLNAAYEVLEKEARGLKGEWRKPMNRELDIVWRTHPKNRQRGEARYYNEYPIAFAYDWNERAKDLLQETSKAFALLKSNIEGAKEIDSSKEVKKLCRDLFSLVDSAKTFDLRLLFAVLLEAGFHLKVSAEFTSLKGKKPVVIPMFL